MKKILAVILAFAMLFAFASCKGNNDPEPTEIVTDSQGEALTDSEGNYMTEIVTDESETETSEVPESVSTSDVSESSTQTSTVSDDPAKWTNEEILDFYKAAAKKSSGQKSKQVMTLADLSVNEGDGFIGTMVDFALPIMKSALEENSTEFDGITGGHQDLVISDVKTIKAYKSGKYTVVEMTMKEQTDGIHGDAFSGTVGHAISVVGDISAVQEALPEFVIDFENSDFEIRYANPKLKVKINEKGIIEKGTWSYDAKIKLANLKIGAVGFPLEVTIGSAHGGVDYIITVGGGF